MLERNKCMDSIMCWTEREVVLEGSSLKKKKKNRLDELTNQISTTQRDKPKEWKEGKN